MKFRNKFSKIVAVALTFAMMTVNSVSGAFMYGDVNQDGQVTASDASTLLQYVLNSDAFTLSADQLKAAKVTTNGSGITASDASQILQKTLNLDFVFAVQNTDAPTETTTKAPETTQTTTKTEPTTSAPQPGKSSVWNFSEAPASTSVTEYNGLTVLGKDGAPATIDTSNANVDGFSFTQRLKSGGKGDGATKSTIFFDAAGAGTMTMYAKNGSSGSTTGPVVVALNGSQVGTATLGTSKEKLPTKVEVAIPSAGKVAIYGTEGSVNVYYIAFTGGSTGGTDTPTQTTTKDNGGGSQGGTTTPTSSSVWNFSEAAASTSVTEYNGLTVLGKDGSPATIDTSNANVDGFSFTQRLKSGGKGDGASKSTIFFEAAGAGTMTMYAKNGSSGSTTGPVVVALNGSQVGTATLGTSKEKLPTKVEVAIPSAGKVAIYGTEGSVNVYYIAFTGGSTGGSDTPTQTTTKDSQTQTTTKDNGGSGSSGSVKGWPTDYSNIKNMSRYGQTQKITSTIKVSSGQVWDGQGVKIVASGLGDGSQDEGQSPIFRIEGGGTVKNVIIGAPGCDGIHCRGDNIYLENVYWEDIGEDAMTIKEKGKVEINGGFAKYGADKCFQANAECTFTIRNFYAYDIGKLLRQNGGTTFQVNCYLDTVKVEKASDSVCRSDSSKFYVYYKNCEFVSCARTWRLPSNSQAKVWN